MGTMEDNVGKWIRIIGLTFTGIVIVGGLLWSLLSTGARKPLQHGEDKHWADPTEQH